MAVFTVISGLPCFHGPFAHAHTVDSRPALLPAKGRGDEANNAQVTPPSAHYTLVVKLYCSRGMATCKLDDVLDARNEDVPKHLGRIADKIHQLEGQLSDELNLTQAELARVKLKHQCDLHLQA